MSQCISIHHLPAPPALSISEVDSVVPDPSLVAHMPGESCTYSWRGEKVHYKMMGSGPSLLLVHAPDVGASCLEWRRNIEPLSASFTVYAVDLPGFGHSDVHSGAYTAECNVQFLIDFQRDVTGDGTLAIGSVLGAAYLARAAVTRPSGFARLILNAPAGISSYLPNPLGGIAFQMMRLPGISTTVYNSGTSRCGILEHLQRDVYADDQFAGPSVVDARYWASHRPNADSIERSRVAGLLNIDIRGAIGKIGQPVLLVWGSHASKPPISDAEKFRELRRGTGLVVFEKSGVDPHEEEPYRFNEIAMDFMRAA